MLGKKTGTWKASSLSCPLYRLNQKIKLVISFILIGFCRGFCSLSVALAPPTLTASDKWRHHSVGAGWLFPETRVCCQQHLLLLVTPNVWPYRGRKWKINIVLMHWLNPTRLLYVTHKQEWKDGLEESLDLQLKYIISAISSNTLCVSLLRLPLFNRAPIYVGK